MPGGSPQGQGGARGGSPQPQKGETSLYVPRDAAVVRLLQASCDTHAPPSRCVSPNRQARPAATICGSGLLHDDLLDTLPRDTAQLASSPQAATSSSSEQPTNRENDEVITRWKNMCDETATQRSDVSYAAHRASSLLVSLEDELEEGAGASTFEAELLQSSIRNKLDGMATYTAIFDTMKFSSHDRIVSENKEREKQISIQNAVSNLSFKTTLSRIQKQSTSSKRSDTECAEDFMKKQQGELSEAQEKIDQQRQRIEQLEQELESGGRGGNARFAGGDRMHLPDFLTDRVGPVACSNLVFVAGVVKGPNLSQIWRRDGSALFEAYHRAAELMLQVAHSTGGWVCNNSYFSGITVCFGNVQDALNYSNQVHEGLLKVSWSIHLLKYPGYKLSQEKRASGEAVTVWRGMRVALAMHSASSRPPHSDTNPVTGRSDFASHEVWCLHNLLDIACGGETLVSGALWERLEKEHAQLKQQTAMKEATLAVENDEVSFGAPTTALPQQDASGFPVSVPDTPTLVSPTTAAAAEPAKQPVSYLVHRVVPASLMMRLKHLAPLRYSNNGEGADGHNLMAELSNFLETRKGVREKRASLASPASPGTGRGSITDSPTVPSSGGTLQCILQGLTTFPPEAEPEVMQDIASSLVRSAAAADGSEGSPPESPTGGSAGQALPSPPNAASRPVVSLASITMPNLSRLLEKCPASTTQMFTSLLQVIENVLKDANTRGSLMEVNRDEILVAFQSVPRAVHFSRELHMRLAAGLVAVPKVLEKFWFAQQDPSHLDLKAWGKGLVISIGMHCGTDIDVARRSSGFVHLGGDVREYCSMLGASARVGETLISDDFFKAIPADLQETHQINLVADPDTTSKLVALYSLLPRVLQKREKHLTRLQLHRAMEVRDLHNRQRNRRILKNAPPPPDKPLWPVNKDPPVKKATAVFKKRTQEKKVLEVEVQTDPIPERDPEQIFDDPIAEYTAGTFDVHGIRGNPSFTPLLTMQLVFRSDKERHFLQYQLDACIGDHCRRIAAKISDMKSTARGLKEKIRQMKEADAKIPNIVIRQRTPAYGASATTVTPVSFIGGVATGDDGQTSPLDPPTPREAPADTTSVSIPPAPTSANQRCSLPDQDDDTSLLHSACSSFEDPVSGWKLQEIAREMCHCVGGLRGPTASDKTELLRYMEGALRMGSEVGAPGLLATAGFIAGFHASLPKSVPDFRSGGVCVPTPYGSKPHRGGDSRHSRRSTREGRKNDTAGSGGIAPDSISKVLPESHNPRAAQGGVGVGVEAGVAVPRSPRVGGGAEGSPPKEFRKISLGDGTYLQADVGDIFASCRAGAEGGQPQPHIPQAPGGYSPGGGGGGAGGGKVRPRFGRPSVLSGTLPVIDRAGRNLVARNAIPPPADSAPPSPLPVTLEPNLATAVVDEFRRSPYHYLRVGQRYVWKGKTATLKLMYPNKGTVGIVVEGDHKVQTVGVGELHISINSSAGGAYTSGQADSDGEDVGGGGGGGGGGAPIPQPPGSQEQPPAQRGRKGSASAPRHVVGPHEDLKKMQRKLAASGAKSDALGWQTGLLNQMLQSYQQQRVFGGEGGSQGGAAAKPVSRMHPPRKKSIATDYASVLMLSQAARSELQPSSAE